MSTVHTYIHIYCTQYVRCNMHFTILNSAIPVCSVQCVLTSIYPYMCFTTFTVYTVLSVLQNMCCTLTVYTVQFRSIKPFSNQDSFTVYLSRSEPSTVPSNPRDKRILISKSFNNPFSNTFM